MLARRLAYFLRRIRLTQSVPALHSLANEITAEYSEDEATPRLLGLIAAKAARLTGAD
jgi:hypothetical protein